MAPERFDGRSDRRSDVYGLGVTLYELLTLRPAFAAADQARLIREVLESSPPPPRTIDRRIPRDLETIVLKAMAKEPSARYATAGALAEDLRRFLEDRTILARRSTALERSWRWCRRNPAVAALLASVAVLLAFTAVYASVAAARYKGQFERARAAEIARSGEALRGLPGRGAGQPVQPATGPAVRLAPLAGGGGEDPPHARDPRRGHRQPRPARPRRGLPISPGLRRLPPRLRPDPGALRPPRLGRRRERPSRRRRRRGPPLPVARSDRRGELRPGVQPRRPSTRRGLRPRGFPQAHALGPRSRGTPPGRARVLLTTGCGSAPRGVGWRSGETGGRPPSSITSRGASRAAGTSGGPSRASRSPPTGGGRPCASIRAP